MLKKNIFALAIAGVGIMISLPSCNDKQSPGWEYMPDMYRGPAIEAYESDPIFPDSVTALKPVEGTIPRGWTSYKKLPNTNEGYEASKTELQPPADMKLDSNAMAEAKVLYGIYCGHCHGGKGDGQGVLVEKGTFLGVPSYADRDINMGSTFYVITYGKNMMGSHATQLSPDERWKVAKYVMDLRAELKGEGQSDDMVETVITSDVSQVGAVSDSVENNTNDN